MESMTKEFFLDAQKTLMGVARKTDLIFSAPFGQQTPLYIKLENLQYTGSFKLRGAYNKMQNLTEEEKKAGVIAASAGNHAQGVALAAQRMGIEATIVMPQAAPISKVAATRSYGANVILSGANFDAAFEKATALREETGATFIHPFNDPLVIAGQGVIGLEILDQLKDVECVLVPVGGGGLAAGVATAIKLYKPNCKVYGVQAENCPSMKKSFSNGAPLTLDPSVTIADGIAVRCPGDLTFSLCKKNLDGILTVSENEISATILLLLEKMKIVSEGAGAVSVAAALYGKLPDPSLRTVAILSGGNIDVNFLSRIIDKGLIQTSRKIKLGVLLPDKPGALSTLLSLTASLSTNLLSVFHDRTTLGAPLGSCYVELEMETEGAEHVERVVQTLKEHGHSPIMVA